MFSACRGQYGDAMQGFAPEALQALRDHSWPGNVRELINRVRKAMIMCDGRFITPADLGLGQRPAGPAATTLARAMQQSERDIVVAALERNRHNMSATARDLGISRVTLYRLVRRLGVRR